jgi:hypothetical protein
MEMKIEPLQKGEDYNEQRDQKYLKTNPSAP